MVDELIMNKHESFWLTKEGWLIDELIMNKYESFWLTRGLVD